jgi:2-oxoglutarate ferredoxin oxidoreductase subunit beta
VHADYIPPEEEIKTAYNAGESMPITLHDGGEIVLRKLDADYNPKDRASAFSKIINNKIKEIATGLIYINENLADMAEQNNLEARPLNQIPYKELNPGSDNLKEIQKSFR